MPQMVQAHMESYCPSGESCSLCLQPLAEKFRCIDCLTTQVCKSCLLAEHSRPHLHILIRHQLWPSTPTSPTIAFHFELMKWYFGILLEGHVSLKSFCASLSTRQSKHEKGSIDFLNPLRPIGYNRAATVAFHLLLFLVISFAFPQVLPIFFELYQVFCVKCYLNFAVPLLR